MRTGLIVASLVGLAGVGLAAQRTGKVEIVSVIGCLREQEPGKWRLVAATDPVPSSANAPSKEEVPATVPTGKNAFELIGVSEFKLPGLKDQTVVVRGLLIEAPPARRLNITSVVLAVAECTPGAEK
jgi:hypothetical protein